MLAFLAAYHLAIGLVSVVSFGASARIAHALYGVDASESPPLRYAVRMLGLYAIALGALLSLSAFNPRENKNVIMIVIGLQLARALCRILFRHELTAALGVPPRRNALNAALLVVESVVLAVTLPSVQ